MSLPEAIFPVLVSGGLLAFSFACGPRTAEDMLESNVRTVCELGRGVCYGEGVVEDAVEACVDARVTEGHGRARAMSDGCDGVDVEACTDEHVERKDEAAELSVDCQDRYVTMIECAEAIRGCSELANWEELRGLDFDYPCRDETEKFLVVCPDLWFEKK